MSRIKNLADAPPRIVAVDVSKFAIRSYGADNGYPQRMLNLYNAAGSAKMCARLCARYIVGKGFEHKTFYDAAINDKGLTPDKLIRRLAIDKARFRGFAFQVNYNALYEISSVNYIPFEHCREGVKISDENNKKGQIAISKNWYNSSNPKASKSVEDIYYLYKYNPDPEQIEKEISEVGGWENYKGQIFYDSDDFDEYPLATIDPVLDDVESEIESAITRKGNLKNNFRLKNIWVEKGIPADDAEEDKVVNGIKKFVGSEGDDLAVVFSKDPEGKDAPTLIPLTNALNDKLFQYTDETARLKIYTQFGQPAILHSDYQGTNGYNEGQLPQSMKYYNAYTDPDRILFEEVFTEIFNRFEYNINPEKLYALIPLDAIAATGEEIDTENVEEKPLISIIGIGGVQALQAILADAITTPEQKKNTLVIVFGLSEDQANLLAGITTEEKQTA